MKWLIKANIVFRRLEFESPNYLEIVQHIVITIIIVIKISNVGFTPDFK